MLSDKIKVTYRVTEEFWDTIAREANRKGLTVPSFTRYVLKKYINEKTNGTKKTTTP
jgi:hypothetical protein